MITKVEFQELVNHRCKYTLDKQLDIFGWMMRTGWNYKEDLTMGSTTGMFEWLYGLSAVGVHPHYCHEHGLPRVGLSDFLKLAFVRAIIDTGVRPFVEDWRKDERVALGKYRMVDLPGPTSFKYLDYVRLTQTSIGKELDTQLNPLYADAKFVHSVKMVVVAQDGWQVILRYGFADESRSCWDYRLLDEHELSAGQAALTALVKLNNMVDGTLLAG